MSLPSNKLETSNISTHTAHTHTYGLGLFRASSAHDPWTQTMGLLNGSSPFYPRLGAIWGLLTRRKSRQVHDMESFPLRFPGEQCQVRAGSLVLVLLPSPGSVQGDWGLHAAVCWLFPDHLHMTCLPFPPPRSPLLLLALSCHASPFLLFSFIFYSRS